MKKETKSENFRTINHGLEKDGATSYCRMCDFSESGGLEVQRRAKEHAKETLHTVDVYKSNHTEYTCWTRKNKGL
jgi:hypothetical protein